eukprot:5027969-Prorocentrum_lima.AAC.1
MSPGCVLVWLPKSPRLGDYPMNCPLGGIGNSSPNMYDASLLACRAGLKSNQSSCSILAC